MGTIKATNIEPIADNGTVTLGGSGDTFTVPSGVTVNMSSATQTGVGGTNTPYFYARLTSGQSSITASANTKATFQTEDFDTGNEYDNSSNYRFVPANGNTYLIHSVLKMGGSSNTILQEARIKLYKNGSEILETRNDAYSTNVNNMSPSLSKIVTGNGSDYYEIYGQAHVSSGTAKFRVGSFFTAFKLIS